MSALSFLNCDKYISDRVLNIKDVISLATVNESIMGSLLGEIKSKVYVFTLKSSVELKYSLNERGYSNFSFHKGKEYFYFDSYLEKFDLVSRSKYEEMLDKCRENSEFQFRLLLELNFFVNYIAQSSELQSVFRGEKWFNMPCDFGGMK